MKIANVERVTMIAAASFEQRSSVWVQKYLDAGGRVGTVFLADVVEGGSEYETQMSTFTNLGVRNVDRVDRFSSSSLWSWSLSVVDRAGAVGTTLLIDITCIPRELLGMLLFAVSVRQQRFRQIVVVYVAAPSEGYATQNQGLPPEERWLSKGVVTVRTIVGYPGGFRAERPSHLVVLAGHEFERLLAIVEYLEPDKLTIGGESATSSTVPGAGALSGEVAQRLKDRIQVPNMGDICFSASSIEDVVASLDGLGFDVSAENTTLVSMNTKLAFVGAALFALLNRGVRMVYAVPKEYNPSYCIGAGREYCIDITQMLRRVSE